MMTKRRAPPIQVQARIHKMPPFCASLAPEKEQCSALGLYLNLTCYVCALSWYHLVNYACFDIIKCHPWPQSQLCSSYAHHFKEYSGSDSHPVQLDFKGNIEGEVAMVIATAPFRPITAIVHINVQGDCFLLWNCGGCERRGKNRARKTGRVEMAKKMKWQRDQAQSDWDHKWVNEE